MRLVASVVILVLGNICEGATTEGGWSNHIGGGWDGTGWGHGLLNNMAIDKNSGKVRVSSEQDVTCFTFVLPSFPLKYYFLGVKFSSIQNNISILR